MMMPPPCCDMYLPAAWAPVMAPNRLMSSTLWKSDRSSSRNRGCWAPEMPALLNMISRPPNSATAKSTNACVSSRRATSVRLKRAVAPSPATSSWPVSSLISAATTLAPSATNNWAVARPIPLPAPVITATFPFRLSPIVLSWFVVL